MSEGKNFNMQISEIMVRIFFTENCEDDEALKNENELTFGLMALRLT